MAKTDRKVFYQTILAFAAIYIIWGTTYLAVRIGIETIPPFIMATIRYLVAGLLLLIFCIIKGERVFYKQAINNMVLGFFMLSLGQAVLFWVEKYISSGLTAVYSSTLPVWYIITDRKHWGSYFKSRLTLISILLGIGGIVLLFTGGPGITIEGDSGMVVVASVITIVSCFCWAIGSLYYKYQNKEGSLFSNVGWQLIGGTISSLIISQLIGNWKDFDLNKTTIDSWLALLYLAIAGSIIAFISMYWLLARKPAPVVGTYAYVNPVIAVIIGYLFAEEKISRIQVLGIIIILLASYLANSMKSKVEVNAMPLPENVMAE